MAEVAWDAVGTADKNMNSGAISRKISASTDLSISEADWDGCRAAAATSLPAFRAWIAASGKPSAVKSWWAALPDPPVEAARQAALLLAA